VCAAKEFGHTRVCAAKEYGYTRVCAAKEYGYTRVCAALCGHILYTLCVQKVCTMTSVYHKECVPQSVTRDHSCEFCQN